MVNGKPFHYIMKSGHEHVQLHKIIQEQKKAILEQIFWYYGQINHLF